MTEDRATEHLAASEIAACVDGTLAGDERARVHAHLAECADCRAEVVEVTHVVRTAPAVRRSTRRFWIPAAAAAAVVLLWVAPRMRHEPVKEIHRDQPTVSAAAPRPVAPVGRVESATTLVWSRVSDADRYRVTLFDTDGRVVYETQSADTLAALPRSIVLAPEETYLWKVEARTGWNRWEPSDLVEFTLGTARHGGAR